MRKVTLRSLWGHKRRLISTVVSVLLGVAFMCGTLVFTDTINQVFDDLFAQVNEEIDTVVQGEVVVEGQFGGGDSRATLDPGLAEQLADVDGVAAAVPFVQTASFSSKLLDTDGDVVGPSQGPPTLIESWVDDDALSLESFCSMIRGLRLDYRGFASAEALLNFYADQPGCIIASDRLPGMGGLELQTELQHRGFTAPIILTTARSLGI